MSFNSKYFNVVGKNPISDFLSLKSATLFKPFSKHWLNNAHLETLLPGSSFEQVYDVILPELCERLLTQFSHENRKQALFELLGEHFVSKYFPRDDPDPSITRPPVLSSEDSIKLYDEARRWLDITVERIIKEKGIYDRETGIVSEEMNKYIDQATNIFMSHFKKELKKRESEYFKKISTFKPNFRPPDSVIHHKPETAVSSVYDQDLPYGVEVIAPYGPEMMIAPLPHCISFQSEFISETLASLCRNNKPEIKNISTAMAGRRLPISLRKFLWKNVLLESVSPIYSNEINFEELHKEKFSRTITRGISDLKITNEMKTPVNELLENLVIEHYEKSLPLNKFCDDVVYLSEVVKILNILYVYDRSYDPHLVFWLFPLHFGMKDEADSLPMNRAPFAYDCALYLNLLCNVYPIWSDIFTMSQQVLRRLSESDPVLASHLSSVAQKNVLSKPKDFLAQIMDVERNKAKMQRLSLIAKEDSQNDIRGFEVLKSPIIFIRKWIGEGFVSVLNSEGVLFLFDQLFMERFSAHVFQDACLAVILLLKNRFLLTEDHESMKTVFLEYPSSLFTVDFIRAWVWIHGGGDLASVPGMNRREMFKLITPQVVTPPLPVKPQIQILLPSISFNDIRLQLVFKAVTDKQIQDIDHLDAESLYVRATLSLGDSILVELNTKSSPQLKSIVKGDNVLRSSYRYHLSEVIEFEEVEVTHLRHIFKEGQSANILITVTVRESENTEKTLGWCILPCFVEVDEPVPERFSSQMLRPREEMSMLQRYILRLRVKRLRHTVPLIGGEVPIDFTNPTSPSKDAPIMPGSMLSIYSFTNSSGPPSPPPETPRIEEPVIIPPSVIPQTPPTDVVPDEEDVPDFAKKDSVAEVPSTDDSWIPFNEAAYDKVKPPLSSRTEPFCLYIDQLRFLPDTATIIKVTGRFFHTGLDEQIPDIVVIPDVETEPRSPKFRPSSRIVINKDKKMNLSVDSIVVLRVYTVLKTNLEITIVGNVIVPIFDPNENILLSGCFQKRLRNIRSKVGLVRSSDINKNSLDRAPFIDGVSITYRLWPYTENNLVAPEYISGLYESNDCKPTKFEWSIFDLYKRDTFLSKDLREFVKDIKYRDANLEFKDEPVTHMFMLNYIPIRLDVTKYLPAGQVPKNISPELMFHYRIEKGINIKAYNVYGLSENRLLFVTVKVLRGERTATMEARPSLGYGTDEFYVFSNLDPKSTLRASKWRDAFQMIRPYYDPTTMLVIQVWGIDGYVKEGIFHDKITNKPIKKLVKEHLVGWSALQLFNHGFVNSGKYQLPLFKNRIHHSLLKRFQRLSIPTIIQNEEEFKTVSPSSIVLYVYDAHTNVDAYPSEQPILTEILDALSGDKTSFATEVEKSKIGKTVLEEINEIIPNEELNGKTNETKSSLFLKYFSDLAKTLPTSIPAKQPFLPIFF